ncbi:MAG: glycosyltransferase family 39 protein [Pseudomonadota bacterium]
MVALPANGVTIKRDGAQGLGALFVPRGVSLIVSWRLYLPLLVVCGAGILSVALGPDNNWDLRYYHLYAPWAYLHDRYLHDIGPAQSQGFFNPAADFLFYALISSSLNETPRLIAFIMGAVHGINAVLVLAIARHVLRPARVAERATLIAAAFLIGISGAGFVSLLGTTTNDLIHSIFALGALLCLLKAFEAAPEPAAWRLFAWSGLLAGIGVGLKYTAVIFMPGLGLIALIVAARRKNAGALIAFGAAALLGFLAIAGHHLFTLWRDFGNPVFPWLNQVFQSPYYEPEPIRDSRFLPHDFWQAIAYPLYWTRTTRYLVTEMSLRDWRDAIAYIAIAAGVLKLAVDHLSDRHRRSGARPQTRGLGLIFIFVTVSFFLWELSFGIYRYAVAIEMLSGVIAMGALIWLFENSRVRIMAAIALLAMAATTTVYPDWGRGQYGERYVDVRVPQLPANSVVLVATLNPVAYFIPFAEPTAQYLGIENNYLELSQNNKLASEVRRIMQTPGKPKFVLSVGEFDSSKLNTLLGRFGLRLSASPCRPIWSNLQEDELSLCPVAET